MLVTSSSQEIRKYSMFAAIFYWDYPPLHQSSAELVLCGLLTQKNFLTESFFSLFVNYGSFGRKVSKGNSLSSLVLPTRLSPGAEGWSNRVKLQWSGRDVGLRPSRHNKCRAAGVISSRMFYIPLIFLCKTMCLSI